MKESGKKGIRSGFQFALGDAVNHHIFINVHPDGEYVTGVVKMFDGDVSGVRGR